MQNLGMTVEKLYQECQQLIKDGHAKKHILISDDDEGNGFHTLFYSFMTDVDDIEASLPYEHDDTHTVDNCVILG